MILLGKTTSSKHNFFLKLILLDFEKNSDYYISW